MSGEMIASPQVELVKASEVPKLLAAIRPQWQAKNLIHRVRLLIEVDPSSACQRLLNAAIHDLREKVVIAGLDIASQAAKQYGLPPISSQDDLENYSNSRTIDLAYRMGLLSRPEWRRVSRCYEIRRDLEHEDDEYEAGVEDCVYIFSTCINVILSKDPVQLVKVTDFKELIEQADSVVPDQVLLEDYENAPTARQIEIFKFLVSNALDKEKSDLIQQNAFNCISYIRSITHQQVFVKIGDMLQKKAGRTIDERMARVANESGVFPYLRQSARSAFYTEVLNRMKKVGTDWLAYDQHGDLLRSFREFGGLVNCPDDIKEEILIWLILTYVGVKGGRTRYGNVRHVFYSNTAAPIIQTIFRESSSAIKDDVYSLREQKRIARALSTEHIERRFEKLLDILES